MTVVQTPPRQSNFDSLLDEALLAALASGRERALDRGSADFAVHDALAYHLGFVNQRFEPTRLDAGKRMRPRLCVLACEASGGDARLATHAAAAIELLHNFTLIHDDIQDHSPLRRHRDTVWKLWGTAQAINAGDAMFALSHLALNRSTELGVSADVVLRLSNEMHQMTLRIVEGQTLDLSFEHRDDVTAAEYLTMISGKTAAICRYACWAGATLAGASTERADAFAEFGYALGVGFQLRDDLLGVWGSARETGKAEADDIRRRKKSLPVIALWEAANAADREELRSLYERPELGPDDVQRVLAIMDRYDVRETTQEQVSAWHDRALQILGQTGATEPARTGLLDLVKSLESRRG